METKILAFVLLLAFVFAGCNNTDNSSENSDVSVMEENSENVNTSSDIIHTSDTSFQTEVSIWQEDVSQPFYHDYIGIWYNDIYKLDSLEFIVIDNVIHFELFKYRLDSTHGTIEIKNGIVEFTGNAGVYNAEVTGTMEFKGDRILLEITKTEAEYFHVGEFFDFHIKD